MATAQIETEPSSSAKDYKIPIVLLVAGLAIYLVGESIKVGSSGVAAMLIVLPVRLSIQVFLGCVACMLTAKFMGTAFGYVVPAIFKLAAIFILPAAVSYFIPYIGWIVSILLYWGLIEWLFELDAMETIVFVIVIWLVNVGALVLIAAIGFGLN